MIKAAFFDIDGTLLSFKTHRVSQGTQRAIERLRSMGVKIFISSGRPMVLIPQMPIAFDGYVTMNGGLVFTADRTLVSNPIPPADLDAWLDLAASRNLCTMAFSANSMLAANPNDIGLAIRDQLEFEMPPIVAIDDMRGMEVYQIIAIMPSSLDGEVASLLPHCRLPRWHPAFTDIVSSLNSKAVGLQAMCNHFGIAQADTIAFGDGGNDIEMLQWAGIGIAMGNASPEVKAAADIVTSDVDHEGIEQAINKLLEI